MSTSAISFDRFWVQHRLGEFMALDNVAVLLRAREQELSAIYENVPGIVFYIAVEPDNEFRFLSVSRTGILLRQ